VPNGTSVFELAADVASGSLSLGQSGRSNGFLPEGCHVGVQHRVGRAVARGGAGYASLGGDIAVRGDASAPSCHLSQKKIFCFSLNFRYFMYFCTHFMILLLNGQ
jgi:hypothetical protein